MYAYIYIYIYTYVEIDAPLGVRATSDVEDRSKATEGRLENVGAVLWVLGVGISRLLHVGANTASPAWRP